MVAIEGRVFFGADERPDVIHVEVDAGGSYVASKRLTLMQKLSLHSGDNP